MRVLFGLEVDTIREYLDGNTVWKIVAQTCLLWIDFTQRVGSSPIVGLT